MSSSPWVVHETLPTSPLGYGSKCPKNALRHSFDTILTHKGLSFRWTLMDFHRLWWTQNPSKAEVQQSFIDFDGLRWTSIDFKSLTLPGFEPEFMP